MNENNGLIFVDKVDFIEKIKIVWYCEIFKGILVYDVFIIIEIDLNIGFLIG